MEKMFHRDKHAQEKSVGCCDPLLYFNRCWSPGAKRVAITTSMPSSCARRSAAQQLEGCRLHRRRSYTSRPGDRSYPATLKTCERNEYAVRGWKGCTAVNSNNRPAHTAAAAAATAAVPTPKVSSGSTTAFICHQLHPSPPQQKTRIWIGAKQFTGWPTFVAASSQTQYRDLARAST